MVVETEAAWKQSRNKPIASRLEKLARSRAASNKDRMLVPSSPAALSLGAIQAEVNRPQDSSCILNLV